jgi:hypothetical protein
MPGCSFLTGASRRSSARLISETSFRASPARPLLPKLLPTSRVGPALCSIRVSGCPSGVRERTQNDVIWGKMTNAQIPYRTRISRSSAGEQTALVFPSHGRGQGFKSPHLSGNERDDLWSALGPRLVRKRAALGLLDLSAWIETARSAASPAGMSPTTWTTATPSPATRPRG